MQGVNSIKLIARNANLMFKRNYGKGRQHPFPTMNDLPVPSGDFFVQHAARNRKYNAILATGIVMFSTAVYILSTEKVIRFNWTPPKSLD